jgi:hypothetical protein
MAPSEISSGAAAAAIAYAIGVAVGTHSPQTITISAARPAVRRLTEERCQEVRSRSATRGP